MSEFLLHKQHMERVERLYLSDLLVITNGSVAAAARLAGLHRVNFWRKLQQHGIKPKEFLPVKQKSALDACKWAGHGRR